MKTRRFAVSLAALASTLLLVIGGDPAFAAGGWSRFGDTKVVKDPTAPQSGFALKLTSDVTQSVPFGGLAYNPPENLKFQEVHSLTSWFKADADDNCVGGSPRFQLRVDADGDGDFENATSADGNIFVHFGVTGFGTCTPAWQFTGNLAATGPPGDSVGRYDTSQIQPGTQVSTYTATRTLLTYQFPDHEILAVSLVVDAGWAFPDSEQTIFVNTAGINITKYIAP